MTAEAHKKDRSLTNADFLPIRDSPDRQTVSFRQIDTEFVHTIQLMVWNSFFF